MPRGNRPSTAACTEFRREERERDRHIDLSNAAFFACRDLLDAGDSANNDLFKPATTAGDGCDKVWRGSQRGSADGRVEIRKLAR